MSSMIIDGEIMPQYSTRMNTQMMNRLARDYVEAFNRADVDAFDRLLADGYVNHSPGSPDQPRTREGVKQVVRFLHDAFPDYRVDVVDAQFTDDRIILRSRVSGTHLGDFGGHAPTGRRFEVDQIQIERVDDVRIVEHWRLTDQFGMLTQLGLLTS